MALLAGVACRDDSTGLTDNVAADTDPTFATMATAPIAFAQMSAGDSHTCGVATDGRAYCWGWNTFGQIGNGTQSFTRTTPALVAGGFRWRQIDAGWYGTCGVTTGNRAYCWGSGILKPVAVPGGLSFRQVNTDENHTCGVTTNDKAYCWGTNDFGELGDGTTTHRSTPVPVLGGHLFRAVSVGPYHSCGVTTANRAYCWGGDRFGELGDGPASGTCGGIGTNVLQCRKTPTLVAGGYRFRQIDAGGGLGPGEDAVGTDGGRTCAVTTDSRAFCWGDGSSGQLGNGTRSMSPSPKRVSGTLQFRSVSTGYEIGCGVTMANRAYCWGENLWGAVGDGTFTDRLTPTAVVGGLFFRAPEQPVGLEDVSAGGYHVCGRTTGNVGYCWGYNGEGGLGDGTTMKRPRPRAVVGPT
jgi:alpha-tubulin suppressor-like RCC1 family protein